jgi:hypothetical protein
MFLMLFGFLLGMVTTIGLAVLLLWLMIRGANRLAAAKLLEGMAVAMYSKPKAAVPSDVPAPVSRPLKENSSGNGRLREPAKPKEEPKQMTLAISAKPGKANEGRAECNGREQ